MIKGRGIATQSSPAPQRQGKMKAAMICQVAIIWTRPGQVVLTFGGMYVNICAEQLTVDKYILKFLWCVFGWKSVVDVVYYLLLSILEN